MKCKICGSNSVRKEDSHFVCGSCGSVFYTPPEDATPEELEEEHTTTARELVEKSMADNRERNIELNVVPDEPEDEEEYEMSERKKEKKEKSKLREVLDFCLPIIIALIVAVVLKTFVFANAVVPSGSMLNTIQLNDRVIASRLEYTFHDPERYDIVIFKFPDDVAAHEKDPNVQVQYYVKRIIGLPGETVTIVNGVVYITDKNGNSQQLDDSYVTVETPVGNYGPYEVPENCYFVLGDNRNNSTDSRYWKTTNFVDRDLIIGKVKFRYYPSFKTFS